MEKTNHIRRIVINEKILFSNYDEELFFERGEVDKLLSALSPITKYKRCENVFLHGPTGSGKTPLIKHVLNKINQNNSSVLCLYLNCRHYSTSMAVYVKIAEALGEPVSRRGRASDEIFDSILQRMKFERKALVLVLDEIGGLLYNKDTKLLHNFARASNNCVKFGIVGISIDKNILNRVDQSVLGSLRFIEIPLSGYSKEQLFELLKRRAEKGLYEGSYCDAILEKLAEIGAENKGNGRLVLELLRRAAKKAEQKEKNQITIEDIEEEIQFVPTNHSGISEEEQIILDILEEGEKSNSEIYKVFCKRLIRTKRQIRNYLHSLEMKGVVEIAEFCRKYGFPSKVVKLNKRWKHE